MKIELEIPEDTDPEQARIVVLRALSLASWSIAEAGREAGWDDEDEVLLMDVYQLNKKGR